MPHAVCYMDSISSSRICGGEPLQPLTSTLLLCHSECLKFYTAIHIHVTQQQEAAATYREHESEAIERSQPNEEDDQLHINPALRKSPPFVVQHAAHRWQAEHLRHV